MNSTLDLNSSRSAATRSRTSLSTQGDGHVVACFAVQEQWTDEAAEVSA